MKRTELLNQHIQFVHGTVMLPPEGNGGGVPRYADVWKFEVTDKGSGDVIFLTFDDAVRHALIAQLSGIEIVREMPDG